MGKFSEAGETVMEDASGGSVDEGPSLAESFLLGKIVFRF
jgi:hypothetical protein